MAPGASATFIGNKSRCLYCKSWENIPDGTFKATVTGFIEILKNSKDPLNDAQAILEALKKSKDAKDLEELKKSSRFSHFQKWIPDSPEKLAAYIAIVCAVIQLLTQRPKSHIEYNDAFIIQYNQTVNISVRADTYTNPHVSN